MTKPIFRDEYRLKARLQPALILMLPLALTIGLAVAAFSPGWALTFRAMSGTLVTLAANAGLVMLLEQVVRSRGKQKEPLLWARWGGAPTTRILRHRETELSTAIQRKHLHQRLKEIVPTVQLPTRAKEEKDPKAADDAYEHYVQYLRTATRDEEKYPLISKENIHYGFARNLWAMRPHGISVAGVSGTIAIWLTWTAWSRSDPLWVLNAIALVIDALLLAWWTFGVTPQWVLVPARAYAERLFEACDSLEGKKSTAASDR